MELFGAGMRRHAVEKGFLTFVIYIYGVVVKIAIQSKEGGVY